MLETMFFCLLLAACGVCLYAGIYLYLHRFAHCSKTLHHDEQRRRKKSQPMLLDPIARTLKCFNNFIVCRRAEGPFHALQDANHTRYLPAIPVDPAVVGVASTVLLLLSPPLRVRVP